VAGAGEHHRRADAGEASADDGHPDVLRQLHAANATGG
jgi:hypothetical protein